MNARLTALAAASVLPIAVASCAPDARGDDILPGHTRPVFQHDWPLPGALEFEDSGFQPADPAAALRTTAGGVRAFVIGDDVDPLATVTAAVPLGRRYEHEGESGAADQVVRLLRNRLLEQLGTGTPANVQVTQDPDVTRISVEVLAEDWRAALTALVNAVRDPGLGSAGAAQTGADPSGLSSARAIAELGRLVGHYPLTAPAPGTPVSAAAVRALGHRSLQPGSVVFAIGGGIPTDDAGAALAELTAPWQPTVEGPPVPAGPATLEPSGSTAPTALTTINEPGFMSWLAIGEPMQPIEPGDAAAVAVMEEIANIRLNIATREIRGLTNRALLVLPGPTDGAGVLYVRAGSRSESVGPLVRYIVDELTRIGLDEGAPTNDELEQAKGGLTLGRWQASLDGARNTAATYATETVRRGSLEALMDWPTAVRAVTAADVTAAARTYLQPSRLSAVLVGQIDEVRAARHPRWPVALDDVPAILRPDAGS